MRHRYAVDTEDSETYRAFASNTIEACALVQNATGRRVLNCTPVRKFMPYHKALPIPSGKSWLALHRNAQQSWQMRNLAAENGLELPPLRWAALLESEE